MIKRCHVGVQQQHCCGVHVTKRGEQRRNTVWEKLNVDWLKCNIDVAFHNSIATISLWCYTHNSNGQFMKACKRCANNHTWHFLKVRQWHYWKLSGLLKVTGGKWLFLSVTRLHWWTPCRPIVMTTLNFRLLLLSLFIFYFKVKFVK